MTAAVRRYEAVIVQSECKKYVDTSHPVVYFKSKVMIITALVVTLVTFGLEWTQYYLIPIISYGVLQVGPNGLSYCYRVSNIANGLEMPKPQWLDCGAELWRSLWEYGSLAQMVLSSVILLLWTRATSGTREREMYDGVERLKLLGCDTDPESITIWTGLRRTIVQI